MASIRFGLFFGVSSMLLFIFFLFLLGFDMPAKLFERFEISTARYMKGNYFARLLIANSSGFLFVLFFYFGTDSPLFTPSALPHRHTPTNPRKKRGCVVASFYLAPLSTHTHTHPSKRERDRKTERRKESGELIRTKKSENR